MTTPRYEGLQKEAIPSIPSMDGKVTIRLISGNWESTQGAFETLTDIFLSTIYFKPGGELSVQVPVDHHIFFYVIKGKLTVNGKEVAALHLAEFNDDGKELRIAATTDSILLFGHAAPFNEPMVAQGPFVMNTEQEIREAYDDYQQGKFGKWK